MSVLFRPPATGGIEVISLRAGLAVAESLELLLHEAIRLKWPNDLMLGERKVGGLLCEARWQGHAVGWVAVGIGLNVRNQVPAEVSESATWLAREQPALTPDTVSEPLIAALRELDLSPVLLTVAELDRFARRDWLRGRQLRAPAVGTASGITPDGALLVRRKDGTCVSVRSGSIELATAHSAR
jgi:BirA family biotin operon repressor/biotin-[acetyl-CoA-carboxylase] ligase